MLDKTIKSAHIPCAVLSMDVIFNEIPDFPNV